MVIKKIHDAFGNATDAQRVFREVAFQRSAAHPNLLALHGAFLSPASLDLYLLCPRMAIDLHEAVRSSCLTHPAQKQAVIFQVWAADEPGQGEIEDARHVESLDLVQERRACAQLELRGGSARLSF